MPDDLKQKAHAAWENVARNDIRSAVTASIEAALAPVLERVARLEELAQFPTLMAENDALLQKMAAASTEGEERDWEGEAVNSRGGLGTDVTQGILQSGPRPPERCLYCLRYLAAEDRPCTCLDMTACRIRMAHQYEDKLSAAERRIAELEADWAKLVDCRPTAVDTLRCSSKDVEVDRKYWRERAQALAIMLTRARHEYQEATAGMATESVRLAAENRLAKERIAELESALIQWMQSPALTNARAEGRAESAARIAELEQSDRNMADIIRGLENGLGEAQKEARAEGREAGIREAAAEMERRGWTGSRDAVLDILAKKPEGT